MPTKRAARKNAGRRAPRRVTPEGALLRLVRDYLSVKRIRYTRNQVGLMNVAGRRIPFGEKGAADLTAFVPAHIFTGRLPPPNVFYILNLELKSPGGRQSYEQKIWQQGVEANGEHYLLVRDLDQVIAWIEEHH